jgi:hypothetical protein
MMALGLEDNWSEIRYSASVSLRSFYQISKNVPKLRQLYDPIFIPRMCLNRYYAADGV